MRDKVFDSADVAIRDVKDGATIMIGGFATAGYPESLVNALRRHGARNLTTISNNIGTGMADLGPLCETAQVRKAIVSFAIRASDERRSLFEEQYRRGEVELEMVPQGTLVERIRAGGAGIGGFYVKVGVGTSLAEGREVRELDGELYVFERPLRANFAFIKATSADQFGNLVYRGSSRNFNKAMATAADVVIAEVDEVVKIGDLAPGEIVTPGIFVDRIIRAEVGTSR